MRLIQVTSRGSSDGGKTMIDVKEYGFFHRFAKEVTRDGETLFYAVVEMEDGTIQMHHYSHVKFMNPGTDK